jgi:hypothetical protein
MRALLVYRDGSLGFEEVREGLVVLRKEVRMPLIGCVEEYVTSIIRSIPVLTFVARGKAGPYLVFEEKPNNE